jgi:hypothetical protein
MRTRRWIGWLAFTAMAAMTLAVNRIETRIEVTGGTPAQQAMARWAVGRFEAEGLELPALEIRFHPSPNGCEGRMGGYSNGTADLCGEHVNRMSRRTLLHEMAHGWVDATVSADLEARFLRLRQLETWNDHAVDWEERGTEHAAEIISWALDGQGIGTERPSIPRNDPEQLAAAYELLTGHPLPAPAGSERDRTGPSG